jgi:hypothetical protein
MVVARVQVAAGLALSRAILHTLNQASSYGMWVHTPNLYSWLVFERVGSLLTLLQAQAIAKCIIHLTL